MFEMLCRDTFILTKLQYFCWKPSQEVAGLQLPVHCVPGDETTCPQGLPVPWDCCIAGAGKELRERSVTAWGFPACLHLGGCWSLGTGNGVMQPLVQSGWRWSTLGNMNPHAALGAPQHAQPARLELSPTAWVSWGNLAVEMQLPCFAR